MLDDKLTNSIFKDLDALISAIELEQMPGGFWVELNVLIRKTNSNAKLIKRKITLFVLKRGSSLLIE